MSSSCHYVFIFFMLTFVLLGIAYSYKNARHFRSDEDPKVSGTLTFCWIESVSEGKLGRFCGT